VAARVHQRHQHEAGGQNEHNRIHSRRNFGDGSRNSGGRNRDSVERELK
jgi:hypothetical protein